MACWTDLLVSWVGHLLIFVSDLSLKLRLWGVLMAGPTKYVTVVGSVGPQSVGGRRERGRIDDGGTDGQRICNGEEDASGLLRKGRTSLRIHSVYQTT